MACPADHCRQPPKHTPPPLMRSGMPPHSPPQAALERPPPLTHGGSAATPRQTAPVPAPAIPARPSMLPHPLRKLSGSPNRCGEATGPISPLQTSLSTARAALAPRPASTWASGSPPQARQTCLDSPPPLRFCERCVGAMQTKKMSKAFPSVHASRKISRTRRGSAFNVSGPDRQFLVSE